MNVLLESLNSTIYIRNVDIAKFILRIPHFVVLFPFTLSFAGLLFEFRISWKGRRREMK